MFINSIARRFLFSFFGLLILGIICINMYQLINSDNANYYFGFRSFINAFNDFPYIMGTDETQSFVIGSSRFSFYYPQIFTNLYDHTIGLFVNLAEYGVGNLWVDNIGEFFALFGRIVSLFILPIYVILDILCFLISNLQAIASILWWCISILLGVYNSPIPLVSL